MNLYPILFISALALTVVVLYYLLNRGKKQKEIRSLQLLTDFAAENNCQISQYERWNNSIIGMDAAATAIFCLKMTGENPAFQQINLAEFQKCKVFESSRFVGSSGPGTKVVDRIELVFSKQDKSKPETVIEIYNTATDSLHLRNEPQLAEKWCAIANEKIRALAGHRS